MAGKVRETDDIFQVLIQIKNEDGSVDGGACPAIEHEGMLWLVPRWLKNLTEKVTTPERIVCLEGLSYQEGTLSGAPACAIF
jgi:hypothetical protein